MRRPLLVLVLLLATAAFAACSVDGDTSTPLDDSAVHEVVFRTADGEASLTVEVADSVEERERGLMGVRDLPSDGGMAFLFDEPSTGTFWMKDTLIPLAIAFVGEDGHILGITEMTPCRTDTCQTYEAPRPYAWAVEANVGWFASNGVTVGDEAVLLERG